MLLASSTSSARVHPGVTCRSAMARAPRSITAMPDGARAASGKRSSMPWRGAQGQPDLHRQLHLSRLTARRLGQKGRTGRRYWTLTRRPHEQDSRGCRPAWQAAPAGNQRGPGPRQPNDRGLPQLEQGGHSPSSPTRPTAAARSGSRLPMKGALAVKAQRQKAHPARSEPLCCPNIVERFFCRMKDMRRLATRFEKTATNFRSMLYLFAARCWAN
jgi:hypothetical protein